MVSEGIRSFMLGESVPGRVFPEVRCRATARLRVRAAAGGEHCDGTGGDEDGGEHRDDP